MNLTAPAAVAALETAFLDMLGAEPGGFGAFESEARSVALASCAEAMSRALEARDRELAASRPKGLRVHSRRPRALATMCGDVRFRRTVLLDGAGLTRYPCVSSSRFEQKGLRRKSWTVPYAASPRLRRYCAGLM